MIWKVWLLRRLRTLINNVGGEINDAELKRSAMIFSPHPDDETLGCGGTIIKKKLAGAPISLVMMTDGSNSHKHLMPEQKLKEKRIQETLGAASILGIPETDITFLSFKDGELHRSYDAALEAVTELLRLKQPEEIFIPYYQDTLPDHVSTHYIVLTALERLNHQAMVYEYPVWFWGDGPWLQPTFGNIKDMLKLPVYVYRKIRSFVKDFRYSVFIGDVLEQKRSALEQHETQMKRLISDPGWKVLEDIWSGEFLSCFFQEREIYCRYQLTANSSYKEASNASSLY